jgi:peptidoglycan/LPS O-acetylase OafA/YrhL
MMPKHHTIGEEPHRLTRRHWGYDALRCLAMGCVAFRHLVAVSGGDSDCPPAWLGLATFSSVSGYLALRSDSEAFGWLTRRFSRLLIPYWITILAIDAVNSLVAYKTSSASLFVAQFLGIAYFTHRGQLIGVHTWFISLILLCHASASLAHRNRRWFPAVVVMLLLALRREDPKFIGCALAYLTGGSVASILRAEGGHKLMAWIGLFIVAAGALYHGLAAYVLCGASVLAVGGIAKGREPAPFRLANKIVYEFYLTHGPIILVLSRLFGLDFYENLALGTPLAVGAALVLHKLSARTEALLGRVVLFDGRSRERPPAAVEAFGGSGSASAHLGLPRSDVLGV